MPAADEAQERPPAAATHAQKPAQAPTATWKPNKDELADLDAIDAALVRMRDHIPPDPYIMTIPQDDDVKYRHHYQAQALQWTYTAPFDFRTEHESIQYLTFHYYEPGKEMFLLHNSRPTWEPHATNGGTSGSTRPGTGANTPNGAPKKKISLDAYKKKLNGGPVAPENDAAKNGGDAPAKQPAVKGPVERVKAETQEMLAAVAEESEDEQKMKREKSPEQGDLKRKRDDAGGRIAREKQEDVRETEPAAKKVKVESIKVEKREASARDVRKPERDAVSNGKVANVGKAGEDESLPPRLSPGLPPRLSPGPIPHGENSPKPAASRGDNEDRLPPRLSPAKSRTEKPSQQNESDEDEEDRLPPRLSPTLPDNIAKTIEARAHFRSASQSSDLSAPNSTSKEKSSKLTPIRKSESGVTKHKSPAPRNGFRANSSSPAVRSDAEQRVRPQAISAARGKSPELSQDDEIMVGKTLKALRVERREKPGLLIKLRYKRARREDIARILKMRPKPDKSMFQPPAPEESKRNGERKDEPPAKTKGVAQKVGPVEKKKKPAVEEKQPAKQVDKPSEKAEKRTAAEKRPLHDDDKPESSAKRKNSDESEKRKEPSTPAPRDMDSPLAQKHVTPSTRKDFLSAAMKREQSQDSNATHTPPALTSTPSIGSNSQANGAARPLSSHPSNKTPKQQAWETEQKKLEVLGRELKHAASAHISASQSDLDQKMAAVKAVESFICYLLAFTCADEAATAADPRQSPSYRNWKSLTGFYGFVKRQTEPFSPLNGLVNSLGVVFGSRILEIGTQLQEGPSQTTLLETQVLLQRSAAAAEEKLDIDMLQEVFPKSWKDRTKKLAAHEKLDPPKLGGQYKLPLGVATTPVRAARAGYAMLGEWMEKERIQYSMKLKL
ncbi:uncharacterized protein MYCFIDRAFT_214200 [Pseudocercospora fijiensis CIRAD86]|uniref:Uncharacterized protein n=1 Tax=Pseudocercospora fijiensis (strain CIRAD86) TaxID=383855 RepID=M3BAI0_PSEFD|nr:uncharacterized protein MYCFIDRAFT_214200 [Pseudocercospora fijiensis CIRAD86]EME86312.1 hypothetical protein MYCFIDRAFT_214200 [Pseudocercospora fijiensis CIRAD86]